MKSLEVPSRALQKLSYQDLRNLSSKELQKYKQGVGIIDQEGNPFTDEDLIRMLRKYISGKKMKTKQLTWRAHQHEKIKDYLRRKNQKGGGAKDLLTKLQIKNMQRLKQCESKVKNKSQKKKCLNEFNKRWSDYSKFLNKKSIRKGRNYADRKQYTPKQQREIIKQFFGKDQKGAGRKLKKIKKRSHKNESIIK